jgi:hypothetical protein
MLAGILRTDAPDDIGWAVAHLHDRLTEHPAIGYRTWEQMMADTDAAKRRRAGAQDLHLMADCPA